MTVADDEAEEKHDVVAVAVERMMDFLAGVFVYGMTVVEIADAVLLADAGESSTEIQLGADAVEKLDSGEIIAAAYDVSAVAVSMTVGCASDVVAAN